MATRRATWKDAEREIARRLPGPAVRVPVTGRQRGSAPDIEHARFSLECKHRKQVPLVITAAMAQAKAAAKGIAKIPLVVIHQAGDRYDETYLVVRLVDLVALIEGGT